MKFLSLALISLALISLALISLTALVGAQSVSSVVNGLDALTRSFMSLTLSDPIHDVYIVLGYTQYEGSFLLLNNNWPVFFGADAAQVVAAATSLASAEKTLMTQALMSLQEQRTWIDLPSPLTLPHSALLIPPIDMKLVVFVLLTRALCNSLKSRVCSIRSRPS